MLTVMKCFPSAAIVLTFCPTVVRLWNRSWNTSSLKRGLGSVFFGPVFLGPVFDGKKVPCFDLEKQRPRVGALAAKAESGFRIKRFRTKRFLFGQGPCE